MKTRWPLLAEVMPECDFLSRHSRRVEAPPQAVWSAVERCDPSRDSSAAVRSLLRLRGLRVPGGSIRDVLGCYGFALLAERPGEEIVFGTAGRFWAIRERANIERPSDLHDFDAFDRPGWAKGAISIRVEGLDDGSTNLVTRTSVQMRGRAGEASVRALLEGHQPVQRMDTPGHAAEHRLDRGARTVTPQFLAAGLLSLAAAAIHGGAGEALVLRKLFAGDLPSSRLGGPVATRVMIRVTWHIATLTFGVLGSALATCGFLGPGAGCQGVGFVAATLFTGFLALAVVVALRRPGRIRHPGPVVFLAVAALAWWGTV
jgi:hypothetical protein